MFSTNVRLSAKSLPGCCRPGIVCERALPYHCERNVDLIPPDRFASKTLIGGKSFGWSFISPHIHLAYLVDPQLRLRNVAVL